MTSTSARKTTQADFVKTALRLPPDLHAKIHASAKHAGRTYNAELISRLEDSFSARPRPDLALDLRMQLGSYRELMLTTVAMLLSQVATLEAKKGAAKELERVRQALQFFEAQRDSTTELLISIAISEASGEPLTSEEILDLVTEYGIRSALDHHTTKPRRKE